MGSSNVTIGYKYYLGLQFCICQDELTELHAIYTNNTEKTILDAGNYLDGSDPYVNKPNLYGGKKKGGGVVGQLRLQFGKPDQQPLQYLNKVVAVDPSLPAGVGVVPLRGLSTVTAEQAYICSMNPSMRPWEFRGYRRPALTYASNPVTDLEVAVYGVDPNTDGYDANLGAIIEECLFNTKWGLGLSESEVDIPALESVITQLKAEGVGASLRFADSKGMKKFIREVLTHINGVMYLSPSTGKLTVRLLREGDPVELAVTKDNLLEFTSFERTSWSSTINEITVEYTDKTNYDKASLTLHSASNLDTQGDIVPRTVTYPGYRSQALAARAGARDLSLLSYPLARVEIVVNKEAWNLTTGSVFTLDYPDYNFIGTRFRVLNIDYGDLHDGKIKLLAMEDVIKDYTSYTSVYGLSSEQINSTWESVTSDNALATDVLEAVAMPYYSLYNVQSAADFNTYDLSLDTFYVFAKKPSQDTNGFHLDNNLGETSNLLASTWVLSVDGLRMGDVRTKDSFQLTMYPEGVNKPSSENATEINNSTTAALFMDGEIFLVDLIALRSDGGYDLTLYRAAFDTVPKYHVVPKGTKMYGFLMRDINDVSRSYGGLNNVAISNGSNASYRLLTETFSDLLPYSQAPAITLAGVSRAARPAPIRAVRIKYLASEMQVLWRFDDKTVSIGTPPREGVYSNSAESPDIAVRVIVRDSNNTVLLDQVADSTTNFVSLPKATEQSLTLDGLLSPFVYVEVSAFYSSDATNTTLQTTRVQNFRNSSYLGTWESHISQSGQSSNYVHTDLTMPKQYRYVCDDGSVVLVTGVGNDATIYECDENGNVVATHTGGNLVGMLAGNSPDLIDVTGASASTAKILWTTDGVTFNVADIASVTAAITSTFSISDTGFNSASKVLIDASYVYVSDKTQVYTTVATSVVNGQATGLSDLHGVVHVMAHDGTNQNSVASPTPPAGDRTITANEQYAVDLFKTGETGVIAATWNVPYTGAAGQDYTLSTKVDLITGSITLSTRTEVDLGITGASGLVCEYVVPGPGGFAVEVWDSAASRSYVCYVQHASSVAAWQYLWANSNSQIRPVAVSSGIANSMYPISVGASNLYITAANDFPSYIVNQLHRPQYQVTGLYEGAVETRGNLLVSGYGNYSDYSINEFDGMHFTGAITKLSIASGAVVTSGWSHDNPYFVCAANGGAADQAYPTAIAHDRVERLLGVNAAETKVLACTKYTGRLYWINIQ